MTEDADTDRSMVMEEMIGGDIAELVEEKPEKRFYMIRYEFHS
jgi:hypothetical protein